MGTSDQPCSQTSITGPVRLTPLVQDQPNAGFGIHPEIWDTSPRSPAPPWLTCWSDDPCEEEIMTAVDALDMVQRWASAEAHQDTDALAGILADDFIGVGPRGFVLTKAQWLARFDGGLVTNAFAIEEPQVHDHGAAVVIAAVQNQTTTFQGQDMSGRFRVTLVVVPSDNGQRLASAHIGLLPDSPVPPA
jgi:ketosteroid isomerase-like protein